MKKFAAIVMMLFSTAVCYSQGGGFDPGEPDDEVGVPLDESAAMFSGALAVMGAYVLYRKRKKKAE